MYIEWESAHTTHTIHISIQYLANLRKYIHGNTKEKQNQAVDKCKQQNKMTIQWSALKSTVIFNANNNRFVFLWWLLHAVLCSVDLSRLCVCIKCFSFIESFFFFISFFLINWKRLKLIYLWFSLSCAWEKQITSEETNATYGRSACKRIQNTHIHNKERKKKKKSIPKPKKTEHLIKWM